MQSSGSNGGSRPQRRIGFHEVELRGSHSAQGGWKWRYIDPTSFAPPLQQHKCYHEPRASREDSTTGQTSLAAKWGICANLVDTAIRLPILSVTPGRNDCLLFAQNSGIKAG